MAQALTRLIPQSLIGLIPIARETTKYIKALTKKLTKFSFFKVFKDFVSLVLLYYFLFLLINLFGSLQSLKDSGVSFSDFIQYLYKKYGVFFWYQIFNWTEYLQYLSGKAQEPNILNKISWILWDYQAYFILGLFAISVWMEYRHVENV